MTMAKCSISILLMAGVLSGREAGKSFDLHRNLRDHLVHIPYLVLICPPPQLRGRRGVPGVREEESSRPKLQFCTFCPGDRWPPSSLSLSEGWVSAGKRHPLKTGPVMLCVPKGWGMVNSSHRLLWFILEMTKMRYFQPHLFFVTLG